VQKYFFFPKVATLSPKYKEKNILYAEKTLFLQAKT